MIHKLGSLLIAGGLMLPSLVHADENTSAASRDEEHKRALEELQEQHAQRPDDLNVLERIGVTHYRLGQHEAALRAFERLVEKAPESERARIHYNLANAAFRSGQLDRAMEHYRETLKAEPKAQDAAHNLKLIERLLAEHQKQQEQQRQPPQAEQGSQNNDTEDARQDASTPENSETDAKPNESAEPEPEKPEPEEPDPSSESADQAPNPTPGDRDGDGIPNRVERRSEHGSNPRVADTDGDGLLDGEEDRNHNGRVDPGETSPSQKDTDRDGIPDGAEVESGSPSPNAENRAPDPERPEGLSREAAERYLRAIDERPPNPKAPTSASHMQEKDW
ncbi:MAG: tetratricopeptide repeat protein [Myxococcota bacterium]